MSANFLVLTFTALTMLSVVMADCIGTKFTSVEPTTAAVSSLFLANDATSVQLNIPPRYMWGWGGSLTGYCGETSFQSAALFHGTWISSQYFRWAAQNGNTQILMDVGGKSSNDDYDHIAAQFGLSIQHFDSSLKSDQYFTWTLGHLQQGHPVVGAVYLNGDADPDYDHIVPVVGVTLQSSKVAGVQYNDLWSPATRVASNPMVTARSSFQGSIGSQPYAYAFPSGSDYGVAVLGPLDTKAETYRTKLTAWSWAEPDWGDEDKCNEKPQMLTLSISVYGLTPGVSYSILRFDGNKSIPTSSFISAAYAKRWDFVATDTTYVQSPFDSIMSNTASSYRTVISNGVAPPPPPTTAAPTTTTRVPTTTAAPTTTRVPTTAVPTTAVPTTAVPTTAVPTTAVPSTAVPSTAAPTTAAPTTSVPATAVPTTAAPIAAVPIAVPPTTVATDLAAETQASTPVAPPPTSTSSQKSPSSSSAPPLPANNERPVAATSANQVAASSASQSCLVAGMLVALFVTILV